MTNTETEKIANGARQVGQAVREGAERGKEGVHTMTEGFRDLTDAAKKAGTSVVKEVSSAASSTYEQVADQAGKAYEQVAQKSREGVKFLEEEIHRYPFTALISAFSVGAMFGMMSRR